MSATINETGPAHWFLGTGSGTLGYLGTCERTPIIEFRPEYEPVMNAIGGVRIPTDTIFQGEHAFIRGDLNRFDLAVYNTVAAARPAQVGAITIQGSNYIRCALQFPHSGNGYMFPICLLEGPDTHSDLGPIARKLGLVVHAFPVFTANGGFSKPYTAASGLPSVT